jgi:DNA polymerase I-like protein with 3'-5' exonuclease and polymerase domains
VCNIARASSIYGKEMRSLFGCGEGMVQLGFDFSSLEARIQGHYILPFNGDDLAEQLLASKPNDIHSLNAKKLGIPRDQAKSVSYALMLIGMP